MDQIVDCKSVSKIFDLLVMRSRHLVTNMLVVDKLQQVSIFRVIQKYTSRQLEQNILKI